MRIALFTNQFPAFVNTFFSRDVVALLRAGVEIEMFPLYPAKHALWPYVQASHREWIARQVVIHYQGKLGSVGMAARTVAKQPATMAQISRAALASASRFGTIQVAKTAYALAHGAACARTIEGSFDHVLAYWGNYSATSAYTFAHLEGRGVPFSLMLHAGVDLYRDQIFLEEKLRAARRIIVVCDFNRHFLETKYPELYRSIEKKIYLHHPGIELSEYRFETHRPFSYRVVSVGRFCRPKGFDVLIRAIALLRAQGVVVELDCVGGGPDLAKCRKLAGLLGVGDCIRFHGWLSPEKAREEIGNAAILAHPSVMLGDAVPTVIKEAMCLGTAVVASDIAGIPELLDDGKCGMLVRPRDVTALASALRTVITDDAFRTRMIEAARRRAELLFDTWGNGRRLAQELTCPGPSDEEREVGAVTGATAELGCE